MSSIYRLELQNNGSVIDAELIHSDDELFKYLGIWEIEYFLCLDRVDYRDARRHLNIAKDGSLVDSLCYFTATKESDEIDGPHRHGLPHEVFAYGKYWVAGVCEEATIRITTDLKPQGIR